MNYEQMKNLAYEPEEISVMLTDLVFHYGLPFDSIKETYERITVQLRGMRSEDPKWTYKYTRQVHAQKIPQPGKIFLLAIRLLHRRIIKKKPKKPNKRLSTGFNTIERKDLVLTTLSNAERDEILYNAAYNKSKDVTEELPMKNKLTD